MDNEVWFPWGLFAFLAIIILALGFAAASDIQDFKNDMKQKQCFKESESETGRNVYCGKACFRPERQEIWRCKDGQEVIRTI